MSGADDRQVIEVQIGRPLRADPEVVSRCHLGLPVVVKVPPLLDDGTPFPTLYWLSCPLATARIGRMEAGGGVRRMEGKVASDAGFATRLGQAHRSYQQERDAMVPEGADPAPGGGVGGSTGGIKCLHAHYAHTRAGEDNPVGELVAEWIEPLDCVVPCVAGSERNPEWTSRP